MRLRWFALVPLIGSGVWFAARREPHAQTLAAATTLAPPVILLEGAPDGTGTDVVLRSPGRAAATQIMGHIEHAPGSARKAIAITWHGLPSALVVVAEQPSVRGSTYNSALFRVSNGTVTRLVGGLTDVSAPLVTASGMVVVQRGHDGPEVIPDPGQRMLRERTDPLSLDAVDLDTGATRTVWSGEGQIAYLASTMRGDEVCVDHVSDAGAFVFALDVAHGTTRPLFGPMPPLARDFTFDAHHNEIVFARAAAPGSVDYEIVALAADGSGALRTLRRGNSDHLMPHVLSDGTVAFSTASDRGLALIQPGNTAQQQSFARLGDGADAVLGESLDARWLAVRHTTRTSESLALIDRSSGATLTLSSAQTLTEFAGFAPVAVTP